MEKNEAIEKDEGNEENEGDENENFEYDSNVWNFMISLFLNIFEDIELKRAIKYLWEATNGDTEQMAKYIPYLPIEDIDVTKTNIDNDNDDDAETTRENIFYGQATRITIEECIEPLQQKQRRQLIRKRNKINDVTSSSTSQAEEEAENADLNEIYVFIKRVLDNTHIIYNQHYNYPKELAIFFSRFKDFWEPELILKFIIMEKDMIMENNIFMKNEDDKKTTEDNYKEYYGPFLMDLADLMDWTNKQW